MHAQTTKHLYTKAEYDRLRPHTQGYIQYRQGNLPGSELKNERNPYTPGTGKHAAWNQGALTACIEAQETDD